MNPAVDCVVRSENALGESPVWCDRTDRLFWVDSRKPAVYYLDDRGIVGSLAMPSLIGSLALTRGSEAIVALRDGIYRLDLASGATELLASPDRDRLDNRFNDGRVDRDGRFWAGTMNDARRDPTGALYRLDPTGRCDRIEDGIIVPNSLAWSPDGRVMYFADTYRHQIWAYDFDRALGVPSRRRVFRDLAGLAGRPDGSAVDADGCLWNAEYAGGRVVRYTPAGAVDRVITVPVSNPTCCAFGGSGLDTLFITSARQRLRPEQLALEPLAGSVFAVHPGVTGIAESRFAG